MQAFLVFTAVLTLLAADPASPPPEIDQPAEAHPAAGVHAMTPQRILATIHELGDDVRAQPSVVEFTYERVPVMLVYDQNADRMRLVSPIVEVKDLEEGMLMKAMQANFHNVLDVRYAVSNGVVWSAFIHPMSDLSDELLRSAIHQVAVARVTFGNEYSSGVMVFGPGNDPGNPGNPGDPGDNLDIDPPAPPADRPI